ncbi:MAG: hypothetical protein H0W55_03135 [Actinobacteria bacterium]|nr:hypothetical protein [Actinomycetota bacterium]
MTRLSWSPIVERAAEIVRGYQTGVTLRQLFYRLVSEEVLPNTVNAYKGLSRETAAARRAGTFPSLVDRVRVIHRYRHFDGSTSARRWLSDIYRRDRTENQDTSVYLGVEKAGNLFQLIDPSEMCQPCRDGLETQSYTPRAEGELLPDPNDGAAICRRCGTRAREEDAEPPRS